MNTKSKLVDPVKDTSTLVRPKFSEGLLLNDDDLTLAVDYTRDLSRMMFRSLFGCGVICGLVVTPEYKCEKLYIHVADGIALDCNGDPIQVPSPKTVTLDPKCGAEVPTVIWVVLCHYERCCAPRTAMCACDDVDTPNVCTRIREGFEIRVLPTRMPCACGCPETKKPTSQSPTDAGASDKASQQSLTDVFGVVVAESTSGDTAVRAPHDCLCVDPRLDCYKDHYAGICGCECGEGCDCDCVILARLYFAKNKGDKDAQWHADHSVRRFIRPVLMRDPQVALEQSKHANMQMQTYSEEITELDMVEEKYEEIEVRSARKPKGRRSS